jgi:hypothetical protein
MYIFLKTHLVTLGQPVTYIDIAKRTYATRCTKYLWKLLFSFEYGPYALHNTARHAA